MPETPYLRGQLDLLNELTITLESIPSDGGQRTLRNALRAWVEMVGQQLGDFAPDRPRFVPDQKVTFTELTSDGVVRTARIRGRVINAIRSHSIAGYVVRDELGTLYRWVPEVDLEPAR